MSNQLVVSVPPSALSYPGSPEGASIHLGPLLQLIHLIKIENHPLREPCLIPATKQGSIFDRVIQDVCDSSQVDFEESGVDQQTLLDLRMVSARTRLVSFV